MYDEMSEINLRHQQKRLEKEKTEVEWQLKEYGWRLDQASAVRRKKYFAISNNIH